MQIKIAHEKDARNLKMYFNMRIMKKPICLNQHDQSNITDVLNNDQKTNTIPKQTFKFRSHKIISPNSY
jgi:hypothetical protein